MHNIVMKFWHAPLGHIYLITTLLKLPLFNRDTLVYYYIIKEKLPPPNYEAVVKLKVKS